MQSKSMKNTSITKTTETSEKSALESYPISTYSLEVSLANLSLLPESERDLKTLEEHCSLKLLALFCKKPRLLFLENVKGLLSHQKGRTFGIILAAMDELGYDLQWEVLNSKDHGVPQNRERVFIVGRLRGTPRPKVFPLKADDERSGQEHVSKQEASRGVRNMSDLKSLVATLHAY